MKGEIYKLPAHLSEGQIGWKSPSNIALVKYWGKHGNQLPQNPSLSFTLSEATTTTTIKYRPRTKFDQEFSLEFYFEKRKNQNFGNRIANYFAKIASEVPFIRQMHFTIESSNSFPHSAGIASSASAFSALSMCLCAIEDRLLGPREELQFKTRASSLARLGSGSACRSIFPGAALWGLTDLVAHSSDLHAVPMHSELHDLFRTYQDSILIISSVEKQVSSTIGHAMMTHHPFAAVRYEQANKNLNSLIQCLKRGDLDQFVILCEMEAMQLHALMLCSMPNYILLHPNTLRAIKRIQNFRSEYHLPICFTLDAGPNLHLLYPLENQKEVHEFIHAQLLELCADGQWIDDQVGSGPKQINA